MMRHGLCLLLCVPILMTACSRPEPVDLPVGDHAIRIISPADWERSDYGRKHLFRRGLDRISIEDLGRMGGNLDQAAGRALVRLGENDRREIASRTSCLVDGRDAVTIDTWDTLSHQYRRRHVLVMDGRSILAVTMAQGRFTDLQKVFDGLVSSITFADSSGQGQTQ